MIRIMRPGRLAVLVGFLAGGLCGLVLAAIPGWAVNAPAAAQEQGKIAGEAKSAPAGRFAVVHTEGTNLIVTDHKTNTLYFYTTDQGAEPGADLKLRGTVDLNQVGEAVLRPKLMKKAKPQE